jgi:hypothetical protein
MHGILSWIAGGINVGIITSGMVMASWNEAAHAVAIQDEPNGFNGYVWGVSASRYPSLKPMEPENDKASRVRFFEIPGEILTLNGVPLRNILYRFVEDQLVSIQLNYEGRQNRDQVMRWVEEHYGRLTAVERRMLHQVEWHGASTVVSLGYNRPSDKGRLVFMSPALTHKYNDTEMH